LARRRTLKNFKKPHHIVWIGLAIIALLAEGTLFSSLWTSSVTAEQWAVHTHQVLESREFLVSQLKDAETGQRGYLLTGEARYLEPYNSAIDAIPVALQDLRKLTSDNPRQQARIETLQSLIKDKLDELRLTIALRGTGKTGEALKVLLSDRGKQIMDRIRGVTQAARTEELSLLNRRNRDRVDAAHRLILMMGGGAVVLLILLLTGAHKINSDITERMRMEEELRKSEERLRTQVTASSDGVYRMNPDWSEMRQLRGRDFIADTDEANNNWLQKYIHPDDQPQVLGAIGEAIRTRSIFELQHRVLRVDGSLGWTFSRAIPLKDANGEIIEWLGAASDITESKHADARLLQAQKLESLGVLAGGVAHDFNNLLCGVIGNASLAQEMLPPGNPAVALLESVVKSGEQAAHLTRQMLAYSGKGQFFLESLDLSALIPEMLGLVQPSLSKEIKLSFDLNPHLPTIRADRGQAQQVFMNLIINAGEAIGSHDGLISVRTCVEDVNEAYIRLNPEASSLSPGKYVCLEVRDTGCGMDEATKARIFDPFFTTKFTGRGLGLAAVSGVVRGHEGSIAVSSEPGKGSCFTLLFPADERAASPPKVAARKDTFHRDVVLVVDDDQSVREVAKRALECQGYTVLLADSGLAAIDVFSRHGGEIAVVVLDLSMPNMGGVAALPELRRTRPEIRVLVSSGYAEAETMALFRGERVSGFIQKPYTANDLREKVRVCMESSVEPILESLLEIAAHVS
jgi:signal transduction histidine kinase/CHASE3 domain sensor protein/CheY-like chemotaxis protein